ncbi:MAG: hypothetical protein KAS66_12730 [Candidatus Omnitrophica bacterium]|nr:hypothetical protein [Candidatus Omnitrophota bacterium]
MAERYFVTGQEIRQVMRHLQNEGTYFLGSTNSIYVPQGKLKYIDKSVCKNWPDLEGQIRLMPPGEAARTEMIREYPELKRVGWLPGHIKLLDQRSPLFYDGPQIGKLIYIDLEAAYSQIYRNLWLDTPYPRGLGGQYPLATIAHRLKDWKIARNSVIGIARSTTLVAYRGTRRITVKTKNRFLAPGLWATVQSLLHWIACQAIECGAVYVNTDGYIFYLDPPEFWLQFTEWLTGQGIAWSTRVEGKGEIVSWNNYQIGPFRTQSHKLNLTHKSRSFTNVRNQVPKWAGYWSNIKRLQASRNV